MTHDILYTDTGQLIWGEGRARGNKAQAEVGAADPLELQQRKLTSKECRASSGCCTVNAGTPVLKMPAFSLAISCKSNAEVLLADPGKSGTRSCCLTPESEHWTSSPCRSKRICLKGKDCRGTHPAYCGKHCSSYYQYVLHCYMQLSLLKGPSM